MKKDDLTQGPMYRHFMNLAIPAAFGMLFATLYNVVDVYYAGLLSTKAQAGMAIGFQAFFILMAVGFGLGSSLSALVSNAKGQKDEAQTRKFIVQGVVFGLMLTMLFMAMGYGLGPQLIKLVSQPGAYRDAGISYFYWLLLALPGFLLAYGLNGILQAHGDSRSMQRALMVAFFANIGLNPLMMFGLPGLWNGMGFNGIALATVISQTGVMIYILSRIFQLDVMKQVAPQELRPEGSVFREIFGQLLPSSSTLIVMFFSGFVVQFALKGFGEHALAAFGVALRIEQIFLLPVLGVTGALLPIAGQNFGAKDFQRVHEALRFCWKIGFGMSVIATPVLWGGAEMAMSLFSKDPEVIKAGASYLRVDAILFPVYMMMFSINSILQALKKPIWTLWISVYRQGFGMVGFIFLFVGVYQFDLMGVWYGIATAVSTGWLMSLAVGWHVSHKQTGGFLFSRQQP